LHWYINCSIPTSATKRILYHSPKLNLFLTGVTPTA
jgi:hypothetical protein